MGAVFASDQPHPPPHVEVDLFDLDSLVRWIEWADIGLLDANWLRWAPPEVLLNRRQELPREAFVPACDLRDRPIVALSYGWAAPANPDPDGTYARMLQGLLRGSGCHGSGSADWTFSRAALFWDHKSLYQHRLQPDWDGRRETFDRHIIQKRTPEEEVKFRRAMAGMQALYFHNCTNTLVVNFVPDGSRNPRPYEQRGWTAMECAGASLGGRVYEVSEDQIGLELPKHNDLNPWEFRTLCDFDQRRSRWPYIAHAFGKNYLVPMTVDDFEEEVRGRVFFKEGDRREVVRMYRDGFAAYTRSAEELTVVVAPGDGYPGRCARLARALPRFERLRQLDLRGYPFWDRRMPELDRALDALGRRGCQVSIGF